MKAKATQLSLFESPRAERGWIAFLNETLQLPKERPYSAIDLFAGCGGLSLGFECAGVKTVGYEMKPECCETYRVNLQSECRNEMLTEATEYPPADIVLGGPPCQPFSRRGKRKGKDDARDGFPAYIAAIRKLRPKIWVCENVKGLPELDEGYFKSILSQCRDLGYEVDCKVVRMSHYDVPQKRERLVVVGHHGGFRFPEETMREVTAGEALADMLAAIPADAEFLTPSMDRYIAAYEKASHCSRPRDLRLDEPARTLTCRNLAGCTSDMHRIRLDDGRRRRISVREAARLQSFPDWFEFSGTKEQQFTQIGNAVPPMFAFRLAQSVVAYLKRTRQCERRSALLGIAKSVVTPAVKVASLAALAKAVS